MESQYTCLYQLLYPLQTPTYSQSNQQEEHHLDCNSESRYGAFNECVLRRTLSPSPSIKTWFVEPPSPDPCPYAMAAITLIEANNSRILSKHSDGGEVYVGSTTAKTAAVIKILETLDKYLYLWSILLVHKTVITPHSNYSVRLQSAECHVWRRPLMIIGPTFEIPSLYKRQSSEKFMNHAK